MDAAHRVDLRHHVFRLALDTVLPGRARGDRGPRLTKVPRPRTIARPGEERETSEGRPRCRQRLLVDLVSETADQELDVDAMHNIVARLLVQYYRRHLMPSETVKR